MVLTDIIHLIALMFVIVSVIEIPLIGNQIRNIKHKRKIKKRDRLAEIEKEEILSQWVHTDIGWEKIEY